MTAHSPDGVDTQILEKPRPSGDEPRDPLRLGVIISGSGTNLQVIIDECEAGRVPARVAVVLSNKADAYGLIRAHNHGIPAFHVDPSAYSDFGAYNEALRDKLIEHDVGLVVLAGYMRLLGVEVLRAFPGRVMNIHPALLPSFAGAQGVADALACGVKVTGVTVHFADEKFDTGPIILQEAIDVLEGDTEETLLPRIHEIEYRIYPKAIKLFAEGRLIVEGRRVRIIE